MQVGNQSMINFFFICRKRSEDFFWSPQVLRHIVKWSDDRGKMRTQQINRFDVKRVGLWKQISAGGTFEKHFNKNRSKQALMENKL